MAVNSPIEYLFPCLGSIPFSLLLVATYPSSSYTVVSCSTLDKVFDEVKK